MVIGAQFLSSRITVALMLTIGILVSYTSAKPHSDNDQLDGIQTERFDTTEERESFPRQTTTSYSQTTSSPLKRATRKAEDSYTHTPGIGVHKIHTHATTWHEARKICQAEGGDLAVINSKAESQVLVKLIAEAHIQEGDDFNNVIIGFNDLDEEHKFITVDNRTLKEAGFEEWLGSNPSNSWRHFNEEDCGAMYEVYGKLNDISCHLKYAFACELPILDDVEETSDEVKPENLEQSSGSQGLEGLMISLSSPLTFLTLALSFAR